jgi:hypothetical protein
VRGYFALKGSDLQAAATPAKTDLSTTSKGMAQQVNICKTDPHLVNNSR